MTNWTTVGEVVADTNLAAYWVERWRWRHGPHQNRLWHDGWMVGRWRELGDLLEVVPGLYEAVVDHVIEHGTPYGRTAGRCTGPGIMSRPGV